MPDRRPKSDIPSRLALGLAVLALVPGVLPHYGVAPQDLIAVMAGTGAIVLLLFLDVLRALLRMTVRVLGAFPARLHAHRLRRARFTPAWHRARALRRRQ
jgi:hypothetical protein